MVSHRLSLALVSALILGSSLSMAQGNAKSLTVAGKTLQLPASFRKIPAMQDKNTVAFGDTALGCYLVLGSYRLENAKQSVQVAAETMASELENDKKNSVSPRYKLKGGAIGFNSKRGPLTSKTLLVPAPGETSNHVWVLNCLVNEREQKRSFAMCDNLFATFGGGK